MLGGGARDDEELTAHLKKESSRGGKRRNHGADISMLMLVNEKIIGNALPGVQTLRLASHAPPVSIRGRGY